MNLFCPALLFSTDWADASGSWTTNANWNPATFPNGVDAVANFPLPAAARTITQDAAITLGTLSFTDNGSVRVFTISGAGSFTFQTSAGSASITTAGASTTGETISIPIALTSPLSITANSDLTLSSTISGASSLTISGSAARVVTIQGSNSYQGGTTISSSQVFVSTNTGLGTGSVSLATGALLEFTAAFDFANDISITGTGTAAIVNTSAVTLSGVLSSASTGVLQKKSAGGTLTLTNGANTLAGVSVDNNSTLALSGSGVFNSAGTATIDYGSSGARVVNISGISSSSVSIASISGFTTSCSVVLGAKNLTLTGTANSTLSSTGTISGAGGSLTKDVASIGTLTFASTVNGTYTGGTTINGGIISISANNLGTGAITIGAAGTLQNTGASVTLTNDVALAAGSTIDVTGANNLITTQGITGAGGSLNKTSTGKLTLQGTNSYDSGTIITAGTVSLSLGGSLFSSGSVALNGTTSVFDISALTASGTTIGSLSGAATGSVTLGSKALTCGTASDSTFLGVISDTGAAGSIVKAGSGKLTLSGINTYGGGTTINAGTININTDSSLGSGGTALTVAGSSTLQLAASIGAMARNMPINAAQTFTIDTNTFNLTNSGIISGATGALTKISTGTLTLTGANNYGSGTTITGGKISLSLGGSLSSVGAVNVNSASSVFDISGLTAGGTTIGDLSGASSTSSVTLGSKALTCGTSANSTFAGVISDTGAGSIIKAGSGMLTLTGTNTYAGGTTISAGTLQLSLGGALLSTGAVNVNSGTSVFDISALTASGTTIGSLSGASATSSVTLGGKALTCGTGANSTFAGVISDTGAGSIIKAGSGMLTLTGTNTYAGGTTINAGTLQISLGGSLLSTGAVNVNSSSSVFDISALTAGGTTIGDLSGASSTSSVTLGGKALTCGTSANSTFAGVISDTGAGSIIKAGSGTFTLSGANTYGGGTSLTGGTLYLQNNSALGTGLLTMSGGTTLQLDPSLTIANNISLGAAGTVSLSSGTSTLSGSFAGGGNVTVQGGGLLDMSGTVTQNSITVATTGELALNGTITSPTVTVNAGGLLQGAGTLTGNINVSGTMSPGNSINTFTMIGDYHALSGSNLLIEVTPVPPPDLLAITGSLIIDANTTVTIIPSMGTYDPLTVYTIISYTGTRTGEFTNKVATLPAFSFDIIYDFPNVVDLILNIVPFANLPLSGDALIAAQCLEQASAAINPDFTTVIDDVRFMTLSQMQNTLTQMLPSIYNGLDLAQETSSIQVRETLTRQMNLLDKKICGKQGKWHIWNDFFWTQTKQDSSGNQVGFRAQPYGNITGMDYQFASNAFAGIAGGYGHDHLHWFEKRGKSRVQNIYAALYGGGWILPRFYAQGAFVISGDFYHTQRTIAFAGTDFSPFTRVAKASPRGVSSLFHFETGYLAGKKLQARPFGKIDYVLIHRNAFKERGAQSIDLAVESHNADLLRTEIGLQFLRCFSIRKSNWTPALALGGVFENRFLGKTETASFRSLGCPMKVSGLHPDQKLFFVEGDILVQTCEDLLDFGGNYRAEWGSEVFTHTWSAEVKFSF